MYKHTDKIDLNSDIKHIDTNLFNILASIIRMLNCTVINIRKEHMALAENLKRRDLTQKTQTQMEGEY
jgi:hypothetical protein